MQNGEPFQSVVTWDQHYHPTLAEGHYFPIAESFVHMNGPAPSMPACDSRVAFLLGSLIYLFTPTCQGKKNGGALSMLLSSS